MSAALWGGFILRAWQYLGLRGDTEHTLHFVHVSQYVGMLICWYVDMLVC